MTANTVCWVDIPVGDLERAIGFYSAVLGQEVSKQTAPGFEFGLLPHVNESVSGCLCVAEEHKPAEGGPLIYLSVEGRLDAAITAVREQGGKVLQGKQGIGPHGFRAVVVDSEGNRIALHSHKE